ncbi:MAG TPA: ATP-binding protein, partial [Kofleriaceae bacterium]
RGGVPEDCSFQFNLAPMRDAAGSITGAMVTAVEVTEQVQARRAVEQSEAKLRRIVDSNMVGFLFGGVDGRVAEANDHALRVLGVARDQLPAVDLFAMTSPEDFEVSQRARATVLEHGICAPFEKRYIRRDGSIVWVVVAAALLPGSADQTITFMLDISERKRSEQRLAQLTMEAESANRAKDEFLAMLGHELRNPLAPIVTALQLMRLRGAELVERERTVIERQTQHLVRLVDDLLDISRITRGKTELKREPIEVAEIVAKAIEIASPLVEQRRHELDVQVAPHGLPVSADPARFAQVVANLLTNAAKYTEPGGRITITAARSGSDVELAVRDTGIGIAPEMLPRVFDLFVQERQALDRSHGGLGLGLSIVKSLVELHGGTVRAESAGRGQGTTMTVRLPSRAPVAVALPLAAGPAHRTASATGGSTVLVVDDNHDAAEMLAAFLREMGHATRVAHDGVEALQLVEQFEPDLALLDIGLPVMDGYELAARLRRRFPARSLRLVAVTGYGQESDRKRVLEAGFDGHLVKPVDVTHLQRLMCELAAP